MTGRYLIYTPVESFRDEKRFEPHGGGSWKSAGPFIGTGSAMTCS